MVKEYMNILALDLGMHLGWAYNIGNNVSWGTKELTGRREYRQAQLMSWLRERLVGDDVLMAVTYETPFARGRDATRSLWGMAGVVEAVATYSGFPVLDTAVGTLKKHAGIKGKDKPIDWARRKGYDVANDHEADALALLHYTLENAEFVPNG